MKVGEERELCLGKTTSSILQCIVHMKRSYHIIDRKIPKYTSEERLRREEEKARKDEEEKEKARKDEKERAKLKRKAGQN